MTDKLQVYPALVIQTLYIHLPIAERWPGVKLGRNEKMNNHHPRMAAIGLTSLLLLALSTSTGATVISGGTSAAAVAAVGVDVDPATLSLNTAMAKGGCKGIPIADMACAATAVGKVEVCAKVTGEAGGFIPIEAEACTAGGGGAFATATMSLTLEAREANALAQGFQPPRTVDDGPPECSGRDEYVYPKGEPYKVSSRTCYQPKKTVQDVKEDRASCIAEHDWVQEYFWSFIGDPTNPSAWMPGWRMEWCADAAFVAGPEFDCIYAEAEAKATSDVHKEESDSALPNCSGQPAWNNANDNADSTMTGTYLSVTVTPPEAEDDDGAEVGGQLLEPAVDAIRDIKDDGHVEKTYVLISSLAPEDQEELKSLLKTAYLSRMKEVIETAASSTVTPVDPDQGIIRVKLFEALLPALEASVDKALEQDFLVSFTD